MRASRPLIGIATDIVEPKPGSILAQCSLAYAEAVARAGGLAVFIPAIVADISRQLEACDGFVLTGGDDPRTEPFGEATHGNATPVHARRQEYDTALARALLDQPEIPVLAICLGMQMLALVAGGSLDQHLPDHLATAAEHAGGNVHRVRQEPGETDLPEGRVASFHRQAVRDAGRLCVVARADDGVIEAVRNQDGDRSGKRSHQCFQLGVQWHPERTADAALGDGLFTRLVRAASARRAGSC